MIPQASIDSIHHNYKQATNWQLNSIFGFNEAEMDKFKWFIFCCNVCLYFIIITDDFTNKCLNPTKYKSSWLNNNLELPYHNKCVKKKL